MRTMVTGPVSVTGDFERDVVVLPYAEEGDIGVYSPSSAGLAARLREQGLSAGYRHAGEQLVVRANLLGTPTSDLVIGISTAVVGAGLWEALVAAFNKIFDRDESLRARVAVNHRSNDGAFDTVWFEYIGPAKEFPKALAEIKPEKPES